MTKQSRTAHAQDGLAAARLAFHQLWLRRYRFSAADHEAMNALSAFIAKATRPRRGKASP